MDITLEYLKYEDLKAYKSILDDVLGESQSLEHFQTYYKRDHASVKIVVAKKDDVIIGTITFTLIDTFTSPLDPKIEFSNFATSLSARGTPTAKRLMNFVFDYAKEHGYQSIAVNCLTDALRAHRFYEKMGFEKIDRARFMMKVEH